MLYRFGAYARLSEADKKEGICCDNSESIENQLLIIEDYIEKHEDMELVDIYIDDGYTGLNYQREQYQRMMDDINSGKINAIITKSLSRLGREQSETLMLFKKEFVIKGIRFIAVQDNIDFKGRITDYNIPFRTLMNDMYSLQTSNDIRGSMRAKARNGEFIGAFASYGYVKAAEHKNQLRIDEAAALVVKRIFHMYIAGDSILGIAHKLNEEGIPCPSEYKSKVQGLNYHNARPLAKAYCWTYSGVKSILKRRIYTGDMVQHTKEKVAYNIEKYVHLPEKEWIISEDNHPAIISKEEFNIVQSRFKKRTRTMMFESVHKYAGYFFCGDCGRSMSKRDTKEGMRFRCTTYVRVGKKYCSQHLIDLAELDEAVLTELNRQLAAIMAEAGFLELRQCRLQEGGSINSGQKERLIKERNDLVKQKKQMLEKLSRNIISDDDYLLYQEEHENSCAQVQKKLTACAIQHKNEAEQAEKYNLWMERFVESRNFQDIDRELIVSLIDRINLYEDGRLELIFKFKGPA